MSTTLTTLTTTLSERFGLGESTGLIETLKATAFKGQVSDAQMTALLIVANQFGLNPWTKEIYAFPDKNNGIVPVVGVDGWARIINGNSQFDGMEFEQDGEVSCTCKIYRKDRSRPVSITEYMSECKRSNTGPWTSHPKRMLRHKAMIQCARIAFGFGGIYEPDEAERIVEAGEREINPMPTNKPKQPPTPTAYPEDSFTLNFKKWEKLIQEGRKTGEQIIATVSAKGVLTEAQKSEIMAVVAPVSEAQLMASPDQMHDLRSACEDHEIAWSALCAHIGVGTDEILTVDQIDDGHRFLEESAA